MTKLYCTNSLNEDELQWKTTSNGRRPPIEDDLKISKVEYLSNRLLDYTQILYLDMGDQSKVFKYFNEDDHIWKATSKYWKWNISATTYWIQLKF